MLSTANGEITWLLQIDQMVVAHRERLDLGSWLSSRKAWDIGSMYRHLLEVLEPGDEFGSGFLSKDFGDFNSAVAILESDDEAVSIVQSSEDLLLSIAMIFSLGLVMRL